MNNSSLPERIKRYLDGGMDQAESRQFMLDLEKDPALKKAFIAYSIQNYTPPTEKNQKARTLVESVYQSLGPVPTPTLPWWFQLQLWLQPLRNKLVVGAGLLALVVALVWPRQQSLEAFLAANMEPAKCKGVAGTSINQAQLYERASNVYCGKEDDPATLGKLQELSAATDSFCMADYFIAHWFLKNKRLPEAAVAFDACLLALSVIEAIPETAESRNVLEFNALLAKIGRDKNWTAAQNALTQLSGKVKPGSTIHRKVQQLLVELPKYIQ